MTGTESVMTARCSGDFTPANPTPKSVAFTELSLCLLAGETLSDEIEFLLKYLLRRTNWDSSSDVCCS
jgi:hypothetical protein